VDLPVSSESTLCPLWQIQAVLANPASGDATQAKSPGANLKDFDSYKIRFEFSWSLPFIQI
jgi:hypothetical protein